MPSNERGPDPRQKGAAGRPASVWPRRILWRFSRPIKVAIDAVLWVLAIHLAFWLRLEQPWDVWRGEALLLSAIAAPTVLYVESEFRLARQSWGHVSVRDLSWLIVSVGGATLILFVPVAAMYELGYFIRIPRSVPLLAGLLALGALGFVRLAVRLWHEGLLPSPGRQQQHVLVVGTEGAGIVVAKELQRRHGMGYRVVGFLDNNPLHQSVTYLGTPVLGPVSALERVVRDHGIDEVLIALPKESTQGRDARRQCQAAGVRFRFTPTVDELLNARLHPGGSGIELEELLGRDPVNLDLAALRVILQDKTVLVTGAGGSIGSEIVRQVCGYAPRRVLLLGIDENSLFELEHELKAAGVDLERHLLVADVRDRDRLDYVFKTYQPDVVFHAAAHKHVPLMEANPDEAIRNNILGSRNIAELGLRYGAERIVNISTDKAVRPTNVMGASKRVAEMAVSRAAEAAEEHQHVVSVRFGNVLGSRGSVIPLWLKQIEAGGPVTVTHPDMKRYFMLIPEAVQLVLQAAALGGKGTLYVLDMGKDIRMGDVAYDLVRLHGLVPGEDIEIRTTGIRPGEKMYEELLLNEETQSKSPHPKIFVEHDFSIPDDLDERLERLLEAAGARNAARIRRLLNELIPGAQVAEIGDAPATEAAAGQAH